MKPALTVVVAMIGALSLSGLSAQSSTPQSARYASIDPQITATMARLHIPGVSVAIVSGNTLEFSRAYGLTDQENGVKTTPASVFRIASTSKSLTAIAAMQLAERGLLDLDAPVQTYAPAFPVKAFPITTRQVLAHVSGIRHYLAGEPERTDRFDSLTEALRVFKDDPLEHEPGTRYTYTTYGYTLLGVIIEGASKMRYQDYMRQHVFAPAGMTSTRVDDVFDIVPHRVRGYRPRVFAEFNGNYRNASLMDSSYKIPGGGFLSTAEDLARFAIAVNRGVLVRKETLLQMSTPMKLRDGAPTGYALGWYVDAGDPAAPGFHIWHGGVQPGFTSELRLIPSRGVAVVILANLEGGGALGLGTLARDIATSLLGPG